MYLTVEVFFFRDNKCIVLLSLLFFPLGMYFGEFKEVLIEGAYED